MLYILEGCDGTGKTTLANFLSKTLNAEIVHCSTYTPNTFQFFKAILEESTHRDIIADRWCYGQFVYQREEDRPLCDGDYTAEENLHLLEVGMLRAGAKVILVDAPEAVITKRLEARGERVINGLTVAEIKERFKKLKEESLLTWIDYNTGGDLSVLY